ncbi:MAG: glucose-6-phosphate isomerase family protein [bacterium]|nr:glucose-6-phosphate isomerase family protein [bacterium]
MKTKSREIRLVKDLKDILFDKDWAKSAKDFKVYQVSRGMKYRKDGLRYDQTVIFPKLLGKEYPKTKGHEHPKEYVELIEVLQGQAIFLLQNDQGNKVKDAYFIRAKKGQAIISPRGYSHTTINTSGKILKIGTWIEDVSESDYHNIKRLKGFCYYCTLSGWKKNKNYKRVPKLKEKKPLKSFPKNLDFLNC